MATLITGITGLLGTALIEENRSRRRIKGIYLGNYRMPDTEFVDYTICDVSNRNRLFNIFQNDEIDCIIHAGGLASPDICEKKPKLAYASNVLGTKNMIEIAQIKQAKFIYISTNAVFDGNTPPYSEEDEPNPINRYGDIKLECESLVRKNLKNYLIVRPILMYGLNNPNERKSFFIWVWEKLKNKEKIDVVNDVFENPILSYQCADIIWKLIDKDAQGIYHIGGKDTLSRYEGATVAAKVFSLDATLINSVSSEFFASLAPRPKNTSYTTAKIERELDIRPLSFEEGLSFIKKRVLLRK